MLLERLFWDVTCNNHASVRPLPVQLPEEVPVALQEVDPVLNPVAPQVGDAERFPQARDLQSLSPVLGVSKQGPCLTVIWWRFPRLQGSWENVPPFILRLRCCFFMRLVRAH